MTSIPTLTAVKKVRNACLCLLISTKSINREKEEIASQIKRLSSYSTEPQRLITCHLYQRVIDKTSSKMYKGTVHNSAVAIRRIFRHRLAPEGECGLNGVNLAGNISITSSIVPACMNHESPITSLAVTIPLCGETIWNPVG